MIGNLGSWTRLAYRAWRYRLRHDRCEIGFLIRTLKRGDIAVDIGAHKGAYTYWMAKCVGPTGMVVAFEPQPELASRLFADMGRCFGSTVMVEEKALSRTHGSAVLHVPSTEPSPGATLEMRGEIRGRSIPVCLATLDEHFATHAPKSRIALIKCDVEGHELDVFRGGERTLMEHRPALLFECEARHRADARVETVFDFLQSLGFHGHFFGRDNLMHDIAEFRPEVDAPEVSRRRINNFIFLPGSARPRA